MDELACAQSSYEVLRPVLASIGAEDLAKSTPCRKFDVAGLTDHLMNSITTLGGAAGAQFPDRDAQDSVQRQIVGAAEPALEAWRRRGLDGTVDFGAGEFPAKLAAGILSIEFLVHAWDYAAATGSELEVPDGLAEHVEQLAHSIITPEGRTNVGFDQPVELSTGADALERLIAFTGRSPVGLPG
jgi:uncharacterized protein (TIGR03086 family)